ncbi:helix-turn-helix domain-containing protein [Sporosarcina limicola]|uniref:helix-turn-helix domain-containing protein n=1 Tax=Sporosarcina limicola TaxID=34101 RepID=UPI001CEF04A8|nr:helix-turn-helix domain-containing protein [Sporosarcina limicola]
MRTSAIIITRARGRQGSRPKVNERELKKAINLYKSEQYSVSEIVETTGIGRATIYRYLKQE